MNYLLRVLDLDIDELVMIARVARVPITINVMNNEVSANCNNRTLDIIRRQGSIVNLDLIDSFQSRFCYAVYNDDSYSMITITDSVTTILNRYSRLNIKRSVLLTLSRIEDDYHRGTIVTTTFSMKGGSVYRDEYHSFKIDNHIINVSREEDNYFRVTDVTRSLEIEDDDTLIIDMNTYDKTDEIHLITPQAVVAVRTVKSQMEEF